jgi:hypothetical protein
MSHRAPTGERPRGSRIDDLRTTHISVSPETGLFQGIQGPAPPLNPAPCGCLLRSHGPMR